MPVKSSEITLICAPIKAPIRHLDARAKQTFPVTLGELVKELKGEGFKLCHVSKGYQRGKTPCADTFWIRRENHSGIRVTWFSRMTVVFQSGYKFEFDLDFWFEIPEILEALRAELYSSGYPHVSGRELQEFARKEVMKALDEVRAVALSELRTELKDNWGKHGVPKNVLVRNPKHICHGTDFEIKSQTEMEKIRSALASVDERAKSIINSKAASVKTIAREKFDSMIPPPIEAESIEAIILVFLWLRKLEGAFEHQIHRLVYENSGKMKVNTTIIRDALSKLVVHGYITPRQVPAAIQKELTCLGLGDFSTYYSLGPQKFAEKKLLETAGGNIKHGLYTEPFSKRRLLNDLKAPSHLVGRSVSKLVRRGVLSERSVYDSRGRRVRALRPRRRVGSLTKLELDIIHAAGRYHSRQVDLLEKMLKS